MSTVETIAANFDEIRRRSLKVWMNVPSEYLNWKPDPEAFTFLEMIRHVLEIEHIYHIIINDRGGHGVEITPWHNRPYTNVQDEIDFAEPFRKEFMAMIRRFTDTDLVNIQIIRPERLTKNLGEFLLRSNYHEATHTGQLLSYFRILGLERPNIWD